MAKQTNTPNEETKLIANDLKAGGFAVSFYGAWAKVTMTNRYLDKAEVDHALYQAGYEDCQYGIVQSTPNTVLVIAVVG